MFKDSLVLLEAFYHFLFGKEKKYFNINGEKKLIVPITEIFNNISEIIQEKLSKQISLQKFYSKINFFYTKQVQIIDNEIKIAGYYNFNGKIQYVEDNIKTFKKGIIFFDINDKKIKIIDKKFKISSHPNKICAIQKTEINEKDHYIEKIIYFDKEYKVSEIDIFDPNDLKKEFYIYDKYSNSWRIFYTDNLLKNDIKSDKVKIKFYFDKLGVDIPEIKKSTSSFDLTMFYDPIYMINYQKNFNNSKKIENSKSTKTIEDLKKDVSQITCFFYTYTDYFYNINDHKLYKRFDNSFISINKVFVGFIDDNGFYFFNNPEFELEPFIYRGYPFKIKNVFFDENINIECYWYYDSKGTIKESANKYFKIIKNDEYIEFILHNDVYIKQELKNKILFLKIILKRSF